jgi:1-acyl-sn-glycerol-3-phosphate acyltransferase
MDDYTRWDEPVGGWRHNVAKLAMRISGWSVGTPPPQVDKCLYLAVPHTAWSDGWWMLVYAWYWGLKISWLVKSTQPFMGLLVKHFGAVPVDRSSAHGLVEQIALRFAENERLAVAVPPEGTRGLAGDWKSGFYHMARAANVPVCLTRLDYGVKRADFGPCFTLSGEVNEDMDRIRSYYHDATAKFPEKFTYPKLESEGLTSDAARQRISAPSNPSA